MDVLQIGLCKRGGLCLEDLHFGGPYYRGMGKRW